MKDAVRYLALFLGWNLVASAVVLLVRPPWGIPGLLILLWLIVWALVGRENSRAAWRRRARARLRPPSPRTWGWTAAAAPLFLVTGSSLGTVWSGLVEVQPESANPFLPYLQTPAGLLQVAVFVVVLAPVVEELFFRGMIQRPLERRMGLRKALLAASLLFGAIHLLPRVFPVLFALGLMLGVVTVAARSLWPAIVLHALHNAATLYGVAVFGTEASPTIWETGPTGEWWGALLVLAAAAALWVPVARGLWRAGHQRPAPAR